MNQQLESVCLASELSLRDIGRSFATIVILMLSSSLQASDVDLASQSIFKAIGSYRVDLDIHAHGVLEVAYSASAEAGDSRMRIVIRSAVDRKLLSIAKASTSKGGMQTDFELHPNREVFFSQARVGVDFRQPASYTYGNTMKLYSSEVGGRSQKINKENVFTALGEAGILIWWIGRTPLEMYLKEPATIQWRDERLFASGPYGELELAVSAENNWLPTYLRLRKTKAHKCFVGTVEKWYSPFEDAERSDGAEDIIPDGAEPEPEIPQVQEITWECHVSDFQKSDGIVYPGKFLSVCKFRLGDGSSTKLTTHLNVSRCDFRPTLSDADTRTELKFPVGARVVVDGAIHIPYRWDGMEAVPGVFSVEPDKPISPIRGNPVARIGVMLLVIAAALGLVVLIRFRKK